MFDFNQIFRNYHHQLHLYAMKFVDDEDIALDIVQGVFLKIWEKEKFNYSEDHIKAYLFNSTRNDCLNYIKHQKVKQKYLDHRKSVLLRLELDNHQTGESKLIEKENISKIYAAIEVLPDIYKEVIELSRLEGLKNKEIAEQLDISVRTVETRLFRALALLKDDLSKKLFHIFLNLSFNKLKV